MSVTSGAKRKEGGVGEFIRLLVHAGIIALVIRTFFSSRSTFRPAR